MKHSLSIIAISLALTSTAFAEQSKQQQQKNELIGFGSGAVAGTLIAGPLGGMIAGIFGIMIADDVNDEAKLADARTQLNNKDQQLATLQQSYQQAQQKAQLELVSLNREIEVVSQDVESSIQFRTASYLIEDHYKAQLNLLAKNLRDNPKLQVNLSGYADRRGDDSYNQSLSEQRVKSIRSFLVENGVSDNQITSNAFGESSPLSAGTSNEDNFFDRRVMVKLSDGHSVMTAAN
ncbi:sortase-associated OmpA-like protein PdsO [Neptunicella sp. SCSIO 80796]|uniref:sortase-associated OmpA-like protein PdsO n=1 Tax=Neptunicella plasticusilytica TaxID=3117012 RepID=UPI003A4D9733